MYKKYLLKLNTYTRDERTIEKLRNGETEETEKSAQRRPETASRRRCRERGEWCQTP
jgi:hypothetical protein